jgi:hypothetical protein
MSNAHGDSARIIGAWVFAFWNITGTEDVKRTPPRIALDISANGFPFHDAGKSAEIGVFHVAAGCFPVNPFSVSPHILNTAERFFCLFVTLHGNGNLVISGPAFQFMPALQTSFDGKKGVNIAQGKAKVAKGVLKVH